MRIFEVPEGSKTSKGRAIQNLINIEQDDKIKAYVVVKDIKDEEYLKRPATQEDVDNGFAENLDELVDRHSLSCVQKRVSLKRPL